MNTADILSQLKQLEATLGKFSVEELTTEESKQLRLHFEHFKNRLEGRIFTPKANSVMKTTVSAPGENKEVPHGKNFIAHISHELRTPLNGIIGFANLLREEDLNTSQMQKVNAIASASNSLMDIINEILEYSKMASGKYHFDQIDFNFHGLINDVIFLCKTLITDKEMTLSYQVDPNIPKILNGDPSKISQILLNLIGNSIKFVEKGSVKLKVELARKDAKEVALNFEVKDTGIGIAKDRLTNIFDEYNQAEKHTYKDYGGTGLGLAIVKAIIEQLNGTIDIASKKDVGTTVMFQIPLQVTTTKNNRSTSNTLGPAQKYKNQLFGLKILVFEDNALNQHLIAEQLRSCGCETFITDDVAHGLHILETNKIDLVLTDLKMPQMSGFEVSQTIRSLSDPLRNTVPIIAVSADFTADQNKYCASSGINDFLLKPYTLDQLVTKILKIKNQTKLTAESLTLLKKEYITPSTNTINLEPVLKDCFGDLEMLKELIRLFKQNVLEFVGNVSLQLEKQNLSQISMAAHKLKAGVSMLKAPNLYTLLVELENQCAANNIDMATAIFEKFINTYPENEAEIDRQFLQLLKYS